MVGGALCLVAAAVWAGPQGAQFRISTCTTCRQEVPAVAGAPSGDFLAVWEGQSSKDFRGISGRFYKGTTPAVTDLQVNKNLSPDQYDAAVTRDAKGNYIVVWSEVANGNSEIMGQRFLPAGTPTGNPFKVNVDAPGSPSIPSDLKPAIAPTSDGGFVVVWLNILPAGNNFPGSDPQVMARRFSKTGAAVGSQIKLNAGLVDGVRPDVCVDTSGKIIVVWTTADQFLPFQPYKRGLSMRRLSSTLAPLAGEEKILPPTATYMQPAISCGTAGTFVVVWHSELPPASVGTDIVGQRFSKLGAKVGAAFRINTATANDQRSPSISTDSKGNFVVVWEGRSGSKYGIFGRRFTPAGAAAGPEFEVFTDPIFRQISSRVAHTSASGNFVVVWQDANKKAYGRRFTP